MAVVPDRVRAVQAAADAANFTLSCDERVGRLLSVLAAGVPLDGAILELGTGAGVGTAWLTHGLGERTDVALTTVESSPATAAVARGRPWPDYVTFVVGDAVDLLPTLGEFDLVFADAPGGKWERLDLTIGSLKPTGTLLVDDMTAREKWTEGQVANQMRVRRALLGHPDLTSCELDLATGVIISTRMPR